MRMKLLGTGDAFGSGGRFNTCFLVDRGDQSVLVDCGSTSMVALRRFDVDPSQIAAIVLSHLHGDHFGGLPEFILEAQFVSRRTQPLAIVGPTGLRGRLEALMEAHFPGSSQIELRFRLDLIEIEPERVTAIGSTGASVTGFPVSHPSGTPSLALRIACDDRIVTFSGDTEWVDTLLTAAHGADLFITECYSFDSAVPHHLNYVTLREKRPLLGAKRVILTHMSAAMLARSAEVRDFELSHDGMVVETA